MGVANLVSGLVGALLVFLLTTVYTEVREARQRARERSGLARLLETELQRQSDVLMPEEMSEVRREIAQGGLTQDVWLECRVRMAQLVDRGTFYGLEIYYREVDQLTRVATDLEAPEEEIDRLIRNLLASLAATLEILHKYTFEGYDS
jgi:hypothetical protein